MQGGNEIRLETRGTVTVFDIKGDVTASSEDSIKKAYSNAGSNSTPTIVLQFEEDAYINSGGIAVLIQILAQSKKNEQKIGITGLSEHFKKIFHMVGITKFATIYNNLEEALASISG